MIALNLAYMETPAGAARQIDMRARQAPLRQRYKEQPETAWLVDSARTTSMAIGTDDPVHGNVLFGHGGPVDLAIGIHRKVGGNCDLPNPGEILAAALASCLDSTIRVVANQMRVELSELEVRVDAGIDTRGTLMVDRSVPVGFQGIDVSVRMIAADGTGQEQLDQILAAAEASCVVLQTLKGAPVISVKRD